MVGLMVETIVTVARYSKLQGMEVRSTAGIFGTAGSIEDLCGSDRGVRECGSTGARERGRNPITR